LPKNLPKNNNNDPSIRFQKRVPDLGQVSGQERLECGGRKRGQGDGAAPEREGEPPDHDAGELILKKSKLLFFLGGGVSNPVCLSSSSVIIFLIIIFSSTALLTGTQTYDFDLQRQRRNNLQRNQ
jgi:hypothetical protein